jgi:hypothetical protein
MAKRESQIGIDPVVECLEAHIGFKQVRYAGHHRTSSMTFLPQSSRAFLLALSAFLTGRLSQPFVAAPCAWWYLLRHVGLRVMPRLEEAEGVPGRARVK